MLHHHPTAVIGDDEAVQIKIEPVLNRGTVYLGDEPAGGRESRAVETDTFADRHQLLGVLRECAPRPPQTWRPSSLDSGFSPRFSAPMTLVVMPEECQSMPMTAPKD